jgi:hypothetical protein
MYRRLSDLRKTSQPSRLIATKGFNNQASAGWTTYGTCFLRRSHNISTEETATHRCVCICSLKALFGAMSSDAKKSATHKQIGDAGASSLMDGLFHGQVDEQRWARPDRAVQRLFFVAVLEIRYRSDKRLPGNDLIRLDALSSPRDVVAVTSRFPLPAKRSASAVVSLRLVSNYRQSLRRAQVERPTAHALRAAPLIAF